MPQTTRKGARNFWVTVDVDGRRTEFAAGPPAEDGGFTATVYMRDGDHVLRAVELTGDASPDGTLSLNARITGDTDRSATGRVTTAGPGGFTITTDRDPVPEPAPAGA